MDVIKYVIKKGQTYMTREEFCKVHWEYYLVLERDFLETERYISFDLGDNYLYTNNAPSDIANSLVFSVEYIKQYQAICSEVDVILKSICKELGDTSASDMKNGYTPDVLGDAFWQRVVGQKVSMKDMELQPFVGWSNSPYKSPEWWTPYNKVKHARLENLRMANLKNVLNALSGLYVLENYFVKYIGDRDGDMDVPDDISKVFEMNNWETRERVIGRNQYELTSQDIERICTF